MVRVEFVFTWNRLMVWRWWNGWSIKRLFNIWHMYILYKLWVHVQEKYARFLCTDNISTICHIIKIAQVKMQTILRMECFNEWWCWWFFFFFLSMFYWSLNNRLLLLVLLIQSLFPHLKSTITQRMAIDLNLNKTPENLNIFINDLYKMIDVSFNFGLWKNRRHKKQKIKINVNGVLLLCRKNHDNSQTILLLFYR